MASTFTDDRNAKEIAYWNGPGGERWVSHQRMQDALLAEVAELLMERAAARDGQTVLDIGCGAGTTSIALARQVAPHGRVLAVFPFAPGAADLLFSRFGVMFFADPARSFANMRVGLRAGARVVFACWREPRENPWLMLPLQAAYRHVPRLPEVGPEDPGPFSFASEPRLRGILERAGFGAITPEPVDLSFDLAEGHGLDRAVELSVGMGPASRALDGQPAAQRVAATEAIRAALAPYQHGNQVPLRGAIWIVSAVNP